MNFFKCLLGIACTCILSGCQLKEEIQKPNIILILADDLGYNDLSCYREFNLQLGDRPPSCATPHLDRLAKEGMRFTDFYCGAAVCSPSRSSLLTGRNSTRVGIYNWIPPRQPMHLRDGEITIAEMLKPLGYRSAHFGKWHLTAEGMGQPLPENQGFDYSFFTYNNANPSHHNPVNFFRNTKAIGPTRGYSCQLVMDETIQWLKSMSENSGPFYINVWFNEPHDKVAAPEELTSGHDYNKEYYGCIENMDLAVGRLMDYLDQQGLTENTLVIFTSDNGSRVLASNDPLRGEKAFNYEGGIRVPFIVRWPGMIPEGSECSLPGSFTDVMPTIAGITGASLPADRKLDGQDIAQSLMNPSDVSRREKPLFFFRYFHDPVCMLRVDDWVLLGYVDKPPPYTRDYNQPELAKLKPDPEKQLYSMWSFQPIHMEYLKSAIPVIFELYDISSDISQRKDIASAHPEKVDEMKEIMLSLRQEMIDEGGDWYQ